MGKEHRCLIAFGANLRTGVMTLAQTIQAAAAAIACDGVRLGAMSRLYASPCFPAGAGPDYVNAAAMLETALTPQELLAHLHAVETNFRRERLQRWGGRTLDLDLLAAGDLILPDAETHRHWRNLAPADQARLSPDGLVLPHPRLQDRAFVLVPMADIAPDWQHPVLGLTVLQMIERLDPADVRAVTPL
jgi:2-amino-4-hydroxy-6-hydroxymethyldihydropteridine diphosphokinase